MNQLVTVVYEKGMLRPLKPLRLQEKQTLNIYILPDNEEEAVDIVLAQLASEGFLTLPSEVSGAPPISEDELRLLAARAAAQIGEGKTASEIIIEDRGEW